MKKLLLPMLLAFASTQVMAEGVVYQEGVDTVLSTVCDPPTAREDGTLITPQEMDMTKLVFSQDRSFGTITHEVIVANIFCDQDFALANLMGYGQWYETAMIHAMEGGWSQLQPIDKPFEWLAAVIPPPDLPSEIPKSDWTLHFVTSEELDNWPMPAIHAWDGNLETLWHSQYSPTEAQMPHAIEWHLGGIYKLAAIQMKPRAGGTNAVIKDYSIATSMNGTSWATVFTGIAPTGDAVVTAEFAPGNAKYVRLLITSEQDGGQQASVAELYAFGELVVLKPPKPPKNVRSK